MTAKAHADAVKTLIGSAVRLYEGEAPTNAVLPYALLLMDDGVAGRITLAATSPQRDAAFQVHAVGADVEGVRSVAERVRVAVLDKRPAVTGRSTNPIQQDFAQPMRVDTDVTPHRLFTVDGYSFVSVPA